MDGYFNYVLLSVIYIPLNFVDSLIICRYMEKLYGKADKRKKFRLIQWLVILLSSFIFAPYMLWSSFFVTLVAKKYRLATMLPFVPRMVCDSR